MKSGSRADVSPPRTARRRLTWQGWCVAGLTLPLGATLFMPEWQPRPYAAALAIGLLLALGLAWWRTPRSLHEISAEWTLPRAAHALARVAVGARISAADGAPPFALIAWLPMERKFAIVGRLIGLDVHSPTGTPGTRIAWFTRFPKRGRQWLPPLTVRTTQPFGLVSTAVAVDPGREFLVYPALGQIQSAFEIEMRRWMESHPLLAQSGNDELSHLRPYRPGDHPHSVHWKASARRQSLLVMERHAAGSRKLALVVDTASGAQAWKLERLLSVAATLVEYFCAKGWSLSLYGHFAPAGIHAARESLVEALALAGAQSGEIRSLIPERAAAIVLTVEPLTETPPHALVFTLAECEQFVALPPRVH